MCHKISINFLIVTPRVYSREVSSIKITKVLNSDTNGMQITAVMEKSEFTKIANNLDNVCVFTMDLATHPSSAIKTGARHSCAKYLLLPASLRKQFKTIEYDYRQLECGSLEYDDTIFVIYSIPRKIL